MHKEACHTTMNNAGEQMQDIGYSPCGWYQGAALNRLQAGAGLAVQEVILVVRVHSPPRPPTAASPCLGGIVRHLHRVHEDLMQYLVAILLPPLCRLWDCSGKHVLFSL